MNYSIVTPFYSAQYLQSIHRYIIENSKAFADYFQTIDDVYGNLEGYNSTKKTKFFIEFNDMIADMKANKELIHKDVLAEK